MIAGTVGEMAGGDASHYAQIASLTGFVVALLCLIAWLLRLSGLVTLISDSILVGFKAGAALTIAMTQLPSLRGVAGGGHNFFERLDPELYIARKSYLSWDSRLSERSWISRHGNPGHRSPDRRSPGRRKPGRRNRTYS